MENTIKLLVSVAEELDQQGLVSLADRIDAVANKVVAIKTAQYVGIQGYAIRNSRCWGNCYRKKRTETPQKAAQVIWTECHEEYVDSLNDDNNSWNKYADAEANNLLKTASVEAQTQFKDFDLELANTIQYKVANGADLGSAIFASLDDIYQEPVDGLIHSSNEALDVANELVSRPDISLKLSEAADQLVKEAGIFDGIGHAIGNRWQGMKLDFNVGRQLGDMDRAVSGVMTSLTALEAAKRKLSDYLGNFKPRTPQQQQSVQNAVQGLTSLKLVSPATVQQKWEAIKQTINMGTGGSSSSAASPGAAAGGTPPASGGTPPAGPGGPGSPTAPVPTPPPAGVVPTPPPSATPAPGAPAPAPAGANPYYTGYTPPNPVNPKPSTSPLTPPTPPAPGGRGRRPATKPVKKP
jgi:hypothetical protein